MNGGHDVGGMHGLGPIIRETNEPIFHTEWERRVFGLQLSTLGPLFNPDEMRHGIERMHPVHYLASRYYEHWLCTMETNFLEKGIIAREEYGARIRQFLEDPSQRPPHVENPERAEHLMEAVRRGDSTSASIAERPRFKPGDRVLTRTISPKGHTRLPRYARGKRGEIVRVHGAFVFPDTSAHGLGPNPQYVYTVRFAGEELWGRDAEPNSTVHLDCWEDYLEAARGTRAPRVSKQRLSVKGAK